jgi:hypothetical protein
MYKSINKKVFVNDKCVAVVGGDIMITNNKYIIDILPSLGYQNWLADKHGFYFRWITFGVHVRVWFRSVPPAEKTKQRIRESLAALNKDKRV